MSNIFVQNHSPGTTYFVKKYTKIPTQGQGSYVKCSYPRGKLFILGIHRNQTRQKKLYVSKPMKNRNHSSNQLHEIK